MEAIVGTLIGVGLSFFMLSSLNACDDHFRQVETRLEQCVTDKQKAIKNKDLDKAIKRASLLGHDTVYLMLRAECREKDHK